MDGLVLALALVLVLANTGWAAVVPLVVAGGWPDQYWVTRADWGRWQAQAMIPSCCRLLVVRIAGTSNVGAPLWRSFQAVAGPLRVYLRHLIMDYLLALALVLVLERLLR